MSDTFEKVTGLFGISKILGGGSKSSPPPPQVEPVTAMPSPDDAAAKAAARKRIDRSRATSGRQSTILSDDSGADVLG